MTEGIFGKISARWSKIFKIYLQTLNTIFHIENSLYIVAIEFFPCIMVLYTYFDNQRIK